MYLCIVDKIGQWVFLVVGSEGRHSFGKLYSRESRSVNYWLGEVSYFGVDWDFGIQRAICTQPWGVCVCSSIYLDWFSFECRGQRSVVTAVKCSGDRSSLRQYRTHGKIVLNLKFWILDEFSIIWGGRQQLLFYEFWEIYVWINRDLLLVVQRQDHLLCVGLL